MLELDVKKGRFNMKKSVLYIITALSLMLVACAQDGTNETDQAEASNKPPFEEENHKEQEGAADQEASGTGDEAENNGEEKEALYELDAVWGFQPIDDADSEVVLLTIDDAPDNHGLEMAKTLKELDAPAIFFVNGHFLESDEEKETLKEIYDMGFAIGNHTKTHAKLTDLSEEEQHEEIMYVSDLVEEITGERPKYFRAPHGINTDYSKQLVKDDGMLLMNWSYGYDWEKQYMDSAALADIMVNTEYMRDGANLLMHDREWTAEALEDIVKGLHEKGYGFINPETIQGVEE